MATGFPRRNVARHADIAKVWRLIPATLLFVPTWGCGGIDQDDMRRYALNRPSDDDDAPTVKPTTSTQPVRPSAANAALRANSPAAVPAATSSSSHGRSMPSSASAALASGSAATPPAKPKSEAFEADTGISDTRSPDPSLSETKRHQISINNLERIATALRQYNAAKGTYPPQAIYSTAGQALLSWRVALLPYLGYESLYQAFRLDQAWNSPHNQPLVDLIPSVYQSPERFDARTNYLVPVGSSTAFSGRTNKPLRRWEDGAEQTVILVEAGESAAVPWTQPQDYQVQPTGPTAGLGELRGDGFFTIWGDGAVATVPKNISVPDARAMFSIDGGESFSAFSVRRPASAVFDAAAATPGAAAEPADNRSTADVSTVPTTGGRAILDQARLGPAVPAAEDSSPYTQRAIDAFQAGYESEALDLLIIAYLTEEPACAVEFRWIPALRRPAMAVRYGVGIQYSGPNGDRFKKLRKASSEPQAWTKVARDIERVTGDLAGSLLGFLASTPRFLPSVFQVESPNDRRRRAESRGIEFLGVANDRTLQAAARRQNIDVMLLFEVQERQSRSGKEIREARLRLVDPIARRELYLSPEVNSLKRQQSLGEPLFDDPIDDALRDFELLVTNELQPQPIPTSLRARHAAKRVVSFPGSSTENALKALSEIKFYHQRDLLNVEQSLAAYRGVLGADAGLRMLAGKREARLEDLTPWIPNVRIASTRRQTNSRDDDD